MWEIFSKAELIILPLEQRWESNTFCFGNSESQKETHKLDPEGMYKSKQNFTLALGLQTSDSLLSHGQMANHTFISNSRKLHFLIVCWKIMQFKCGKNLHLTFKFKYIYNIIKVNE